MNKSRVLVTMIVIGGLGVGGYLYRRADAGEAPAYRTALVERGDIESAVTSTGTLNAVTTVQVGTQVSGQVSDILVDFNDHVKKGQLVARIDTTLQAQAVREAQTVVDRAGVDLKQTQNEYDRNSNLYKQGVLSEIEFQSSEYKLELSKASMKSALIGLDRAQRNLSYTSIYAPIDGIVVERNVNPGQTVAASLSAPQLFLIANDLTHMQILAAVDESDIGLIHNGQPVRFTVQAYPNDKFTGAVRQVRLQSATLENVVNYTVVVEVTNPDGKLLPGMTATVEFLTGSATSVFLVPNAALRFRATPEMMSIAFPGAAEGGRGSSASAAPSAGGGSSTGAAPSGGGGRAGGRGGRGGGGGAGGAGGGRTGGAGGARGGAATNTLVPGSTSMLWYLGPEGKPHVTRVHIGITDGQRTAIEGDNITEGMPVIVGLMTPTAAPATGSTNPLQPQGRGGFGGGPGGGGGGPPGRGR